MARLGDAMSAGVNIYPDLAGFGRKLAEGVKKDTKAVKGSVDVTAKLNDAAFQLTARDLERRRDDLNKKLVSVPVDMNDKAARAKLLDLTARLDVLNRKKIDPEIELAGAARLSAQLLRLDAQLDEFGRKRETATVDVDVNDKSGLLGKLGGAGSSGSLGLALSPALIPAISGLLPAVGAVTASLGAATVVTGLFGAMVKTVFSGAGKDAKTLDTAQANLAKAETARAQATTKAQRAAADKKIAAARDTIAQVQAEGAAYNQVLALSGKVTTAWKDTSRQIATPVLVPWLSAVSRLMGDLKPLVQPVADDFRAWGQDVDHYFASGKGSAEIRKIATAIGSFASDQLIALVTFFTDMGKGVANLVRDIAGHGTDFYAFGVHLQAWGAAFLDWSKSKAARQDVNKFLDWLHANGGKVAELAGSIAKAVSTLAPGLTAAGELELQAITAFLNLVSALPPGVAKPLAEVAGAALILSKLPGGGKVIKFTIDAVLGKGFGTAAGAEAAGGAGGALGLWAKLFPGATLAAAGGLAVSLAVGVAAGAGLALLVQQYNKLSHPAPKGQTGPRGFAPDAQDTNAWKRYDNAVSGAQQSLHYAGLAADNLRTKNLVPLQGQVGRVSGGIQGLSGIINNTALDALRQAGTHSDNLRTRNLTPLLGQVGKVSGGIQGLAHYMHPGLTGAADTGGSHVDNFRTRNLGPLQGSLSKTSGGVQGLQGYINALHGKTVDVGVHGSGSGGAKVTVSSVGGGAFAGKLVAISNRAAGGMIGGGVPGRDSVPAMLMPGELVVPTSMVAAGAVDHLRGRLPGFAAGGLVNPTGFVTGTEGTYGADSRGAYSSVFTAAFQGVANSVIKALAAQARAAQANPFAGITGVPSTGAFSQSAAVAQAYAKSILWAYGWGPGQFPSLQALWNGESGWRWNALNGASGAYGIPQALPASKMAAAGADWRTNYQTQIRWGLGYIKNTRGYGSPSIVYAKWLARSPHWYAGGGLVPGMASGGAAGSKAPPKQQFGPWLSQLKAAQSHEYFDWSGLWWSFLRGPAKYRTKPVLTALRGLEKREYAEQLAYNALVAHSSGSVADLNALPGRISLLGTRAKAATGALQPSLLGHLPGGHPGWLKALTGQLKAITTLTGREPYLPPWAPGSLGASHSVLGGVLTFDRGGLWPSGTLGWNGSGKTETVIPGGARQTVQVELSVTGGDAELVALLRRIVRVRGGSVQTAFGAPGVK